MLPPSELLRRCSRREPVVKDASVAKRERGGSRDASAAGEEDSLRREMDSLGPREIPDEAYWGAQTSRAIENYPVSGERAHPELIVAYARIKRACAETNLEMGRLDAEKVR